MADTQNPDVRVVIAGESRPLTEALAKAERAEARAHHRKLYGEPDDDPHGWGAAYAAVSPRTPCAGDGT